MSKYLCLSDIHLNINRRMDDTVAALSQISLLAQSHSVDHVVILGDIYTSRRPHPSERKAFADWIKNLSKNGINEILVLKGNHDVFPDGAHNFVEYESLTIEENVKILDNPFFYESMTGERLFLGHMLLREAKIGATNYQVPDAMSVEELINQYPKFDVYMLGDVHKHQLLLEDPLVVYAGGIEHTDFSERNDPKGVIILDCDPTNELSWEFVPIKTRPMIQIDIDLNKPAPVINKAQAEGAIVKVIYHGTPEQIQKVNESKVKEVLQERCKELIIQYDVIREAVKRDKNVNESVRPDDALMLYLSKLEDISEEEKKETAALAREIMCND